jgi:hypothetical protein
MMLIDEQYDWENISSNEVFDYSKTFKGNDDKLSLVETVKTAMDYLNLAFEGKDTLLLKKVHFPMTILTALKALELEVHPMTFSDWREEFKLAYKEKSDIKTKYKHFCGAGSVKKDRTLGRITEMQAHMEAYVATRKPVTSKLDELLLEGSKEEQTA